MKMDEQDKERLRQWEEALENSNYKLRNRKYNFIKSIFAVIGVLAILTLMFGYVYGVSIDDELTIKVEHSIDEDSLQNIPPSLIRSLDDYIESIINKYKEEK